jgi:uncharacterized membrane-anchored protein YitT (DUF2179 family)
MENQPNLHGEKPLSFSTIVLDLLICFIAASFVACSLFYFCNYNHFAPGGVSGIASILAFLVSESGGGDISSYMSVFMLALNLPIFVLVAIFVSKKTGIMLSVYLLSQSIILVALKDLHQSGMLDYYAALPSDPLFQEGNNPIFAAIGVGVFSGIGFSLIIRRFGASGGTYAITALIKKWKPEINLAWFSFIMDASIVVLTLFVYRSGINPVFSTLANVFISDLVVDFALRGIKSGYKCEIITTQADELANELMQTLGRGVTTVHAEGMYTHSDKVLLICIVRKRQVGEFLKILKKYDATFAYSCHINEVYGKFESKPKKQPFEEK